MRLNFRLLATVLFFACLPARSQSLACYQKCMDEQTKPVQWELLETGARCTDGEPMKSFTRGHPAPPGRRWLEIEAIETFEGTRDSVGTIISGGKTLNVVSYCHNTLEAKHRIYAKHGPDGIDGDESHRVCTKKCN